MNGSSNRRFSIDYTKRDQPTRTRSGASLPGRTTRTLSDPARGLSPLAGPFSGAMLRGDATGTIDNATLQERATSSLYEKHQTLATFRLLGEQETQPPCSQGRPSQLFGPGEQLKHLAQETTPHRWMQAEHLSTYIQVTNLVD